jgi:integrase/recombinase XerC
MLLDELLKQKFQIQSIPSLDALPDTELTNYLGEYLVDCRSDGKTKKTLIAYREFIGYFIKFLHDVGIMAPAKGITRNHIRLFVVSLQERGLVPETVNAYYRAVHTFFNWLVRDEKIEEGKNPFDKTNAPRIPKKMVKAWSDDVVTRILKIVEPDNSFVGMRNKAIVLMFFDTGLRESELASIQLADLYVNQGLIRVMGKGQKERIVKMGEETQKSLWRYITKRNDKYPCLWVTEERKPIGLRGIETAIRRISNRAGIPKDIKRGAHSYRHTCATNYLKNGGNLKTLQELFGHANISTTQKYLDVLGSEQLIKDHEKASPVDNFLKNRRQQTHN